MPTTKHAPLFDLTPDELLDRMFSSALPPALPPVTNRTTSATISAAFEEQFGEPVAAMAETFPAPLSGPYSFPRVMHEADYELAYEALWTALHNLKAAQARYDQRPSKHNCGRIQSAEALYRRAKAEADRLNVTLIERDAMVAPWADGKEG